MRIHLISRLLKNEEGIGRKYLEKENAFFVVEIKNKEGKQDQVNNADSAIIFLIIH